MFKPNQRVVFVDCSLPRHPDVIYPQLHEIVTIDTLGQIAVNSPVFCTLKEYPKPRKGACNGILSICFRPIDEAFAEETLERIMTEINEESLIQIKTC